MNPQSSMGSVISAHHLQRIHKMVETRISGTILTGGEPLKDRSSLDGFNFSRGSFYPPTVIEDVSLEDDLWKEEVFGPVVVLRKFEVSAEISFTSTIASYPLFRRRARAWSLPITRDTGSGLASGPKTYRVRTKWQRNCSPAWCG
jgi:hypothetical protein